MVTAAAVSGAVPATARTPAVTHAAPASTAISAPARGAALAAGLTRLTELFAERLLPADKAAAKYGTDLPIDDPARERLILDDVTARAVRLGLDSVTVRVPAAAR